MKRGEHIDLAEFIDTPDALVIKGKASEFTITWAVLKRLLKAHEGRKND